MLCHPSSSWTVSAPSQVDAPTPEFNKKQHIDGFQPGGLDGEEVAGHDLMFVVCEKRAPAAPLLASLWGGRNARSFEHIADGRAPDLVSEFAELTLQLAVAPRRVFLGEAQEQQFNLRTDARSAVWYLVLERPFSPNKLAMPLQVRVGFEQEYNLTESVASIGRQSCHFTSEDEQRALLPPRNARWVGLLALENPQLLAQEKNFEVLVMVSLPAQSDEVEQQRERLGEKKEKHAR